VPSLINACSAVIPGETLRRREKNIASANFSPRPHSRWWPRGAIPLAYPRNRW